MLARDPASRTQLARSEATRARVLDAAVECIAAEGFQATNLSRIARQAGMTTGAIQHQFGDKATLLAEVVERGFERMVDRLARLPGGELPIDERVAALVGALWEGYDAASTRASLEILLAMRGDESFHRRSLEFVASMRDRIDRLWMGTFWDVDCGRGRHVEAQRLVFTTLNGLALERMFVPGMARSEPVLAHLGAGVLAILKGDQE
ncbi:MAG: helix-turn-helix domain-containing protein [Myxococcota bacterium]|nr:helix-turn-helix domain-containing protein [Myxococcota bacterium]